MCFATLGSKREGTPFNGFAFLARTNIASIFKVEELAIAENLKSTQNWEPGRFMFSDSKNWKLSKNY
jgi:hypothetical protein